MFFLVHFEFSNFSGCNFHFLSCHDMLVADTHFGAVVKHYKSLSNTFVNQENEMIRRTNPSSLSHKQAKMVCFHFVILHICNLLANVANYFCQLLCLFSVSSMMFGVLEYIKHLWKRSSCLYVVTEAGIPEKRKLVETGSRKYFTLPQGRAVWSVLICLHFLLNPWVGTLSKYIKGRKLKGEE